MKMSVMYCCLWLQLVACVVASRVSIEPSVQTVSIGQNATLVCSTPINQFVDWKLWTGEYSEQGITDLGRPRRGFGSKYITYTDAAGNHVLVITNVQIDDIGMYTCVDNRGFGEVASAKVNVVDIEMSTDVSTREPLLSDPGTEVGTTTIALIIVVPTIVILIIVLAMVMLLGHICLSKGKKTRCCCYSRIDNPTMTDESLMQKSDCHGKVSVVIEN